MRQHISEKGCRSALESALSKVLRRVLKKGCVMEFSRRGVLRRGSHGGGFRRS